MKLSQWHDEDVNPVHIGVYETRHENDDIDGEYYQYWNGERFGGASCDIETALQYKDSKNGSQNVKWRGIAKEEK